MRSRHADVDEDREDSRTPFPFALAVLELSRPSSELFRSVCRHLVDAFPTPPDGWTVSIFTADERPGGRRIRCGTVIFTPAAASPPGPRTFDLLGYPNSEDLDTGAVIVQAALAESSGRTWLRLSVIELMEPSRPSGDLVPRLGPQVVVPVLHELEPLLLSGEARLPGGLPLLGRYDDPKALMTLLQSPERKVPVLVVAGLDELPPSIRQAFLTSHFMLHVAQVPARLGSFLGPHPVLSLGAGETLLFPPEPSAETVVLGDCRQETWSAGFLKTLRNDLPIDLKLWIDSVWLADSLELIHSNLLTRVRLLRARGDLLGVDLRPLEVLLQSQVDAQREAQAQLAAHPSEESIAAFERASGGLECASSLLDTAEEWARDARPGREPHHDAEADGFADELLAGLNLDPRWQPRLAELVASEPAAWRTACRAVGEIGALPLIELPLPELPLQRATSTEQVAPDARPSLPGRWRVDGGRRPKEGEAGRSRVRESSIDPARLVVPVDLVPPMRSVGAAVEWALQRCPSLAVDDACAESASSCTYPFPRRPAADLLTLEALVVAWREGLLSGSFGAAARAVYPGAYRSGVSEYALAKYRRDYERIYQGRVVLLGPHVARSASGGTWRLYWHLDGDSRTALVGWAGPKLRDKGYRGGAR